jgi:hypothetical protein
MEKLKVRIDSLHSKVAQIPNFEKFAEKLKKLLLKVDKLSQAKEKANSAKLQKLTEKFDKIEAQFEKLCTTELEATWKRVLKKLNSEIKPFAPAFNAQLVSLQQEMKGDKIEERLGELSQLVREVRTKKAGSSIKVASSTQDKEDEQQKEFRKIIEQFNKSIDNFIVALTPIRAFTSSPQLEKNLVVIQNLHATLERSSQGTEQLGKELSRFEAHSTRNKQQLELSKELAIELLKDSFQDLCRKVAGYMDGKKILDKAFKNELDKLKKDIEDDLNKLSQKKELVQINLQEYTNKYKKYIEQIKSQCLP